MIESKEGIIPVDLRPGSSGAGLQIGCLPGNDRREGQRVLGIVSQGEIAAEIPSSLPNRFVRTGLSYRDLASGIDDQQPTVASRVDLSVA